MRPRPVAQKNPCYTCAQPGGAVAIGTPANAARTWRFGVFEIDARTGQLRRNGQPVRLREQSSRILIYLLENAGEMVTREELRRVLWPADTFVDFDHSLNTAMMKLRDTLGDSADAPLYIETIPKRGYRFIAPIAQVPESRPDFRPDPHPHPPPEASLADARTTAVTPTPLAAGPFPDSLSERHADPRTGQPADPPWERASPLASPAPTPPSASRPRHWHGPPALILGMLILALAATTAFLLTRHWTKPASANPGNPNTTNPASANQADTDTNLRIVPVTSASGDAVWPSFSPDGREIAFVWDGPERSRYDIYAQLLGADLPLRLTYSKSGLLGPPAWSPDGRNIAFGRCDGKNDGIYLVPALGGAERKLTSVGCLYTAPSPVSWLAGGQQMLMIDYCTAPAPGPGSPAPHFGVVLFSLATGDKRCLTGSSSGPDNGFKFSLSPDGSAIAYRSSPCCDIYAVRLSGGTPRNIAADGQLGCSTLTDFDCLGLMWTSDSKSIVFLSSRTALPSLWRVSAQGGPVTRETTYHALGAFSPDGRRFAYSEKTSSEPPAIWRADLAAPGGPVLRHARLIHSQYTDMDAQPSTDGSRIVWNSTRTGFPEIWSSRANGGDPVQLTHLNRYSGTPRWSPDGRWVAFDTYTGGGAQVFVIDAEGRNLRPITTSPGDNMVPSWSTDGRSIYFVSKRTGSAQVWKHSLESGREQQLTQHGGFNPFESLDGAAVYYSRFDRAGIWSIPAAGGPESQVIADNPQVGYWGHWAVTRTGLYFLNTDAQPRPTIEWYSFATRRTTPVLTLEQKPAHLQSSLSATPDGRTLYYTQYDRQSVIKMRDTSP